MSSFARIRFAVVAVTLLTGAAWGQDKLQISIVDDGDGHGTGIVRFNDGTTMDLSEFRSAKGGAVSIPAAGNKAQMVQEIRQRNADAMRQQLGASQEEWSILEAKIATIEALRKAVGEPTGPMGNAAAVSASVGEIAAHLRNAASDLKRGLTDNVSATELKQLMTSYREARNHALTALANARKDLMSIVTSQQEAILLQRGTLN